MAKGKEELDRAALIFLPNFKKVLARALSRPYDIRVVNRASLESIMTFPGMILEGPGQNLQDEALKLIITFYRVFRGGCRKY